MVKCLQTMAGVICVLLLLVASTGCDVFPREQKVLNVTMLMARGGLGDRSFNDSAYAGLQEAQRELGIRFKTIDFTSDEGNLAALRSAAREGDALIIGVGYENVDSIDTVAAEFPDRRFAILDTEGTGENVASVVYREPEGDFLMGVLAAMLTQSGRVGFIGGVEIPLLQRMAIGFQQGVAYQSEDVQVVTGYAGSFADPESGKLMALEQYETGVDVIYNAAGRTGLGIIEAAKETGELTIGTSGDQRYLAPGNVVGNRPKRLDTAVITLIREVRDGRFEPGVRSLGLKEGGLSTGPFDTDLVTDDMRKRLDELEKKIVDGEIVVDAQS